MGNPGDAPMEIDFDDNAEDVPNPENTIKVLTAEEKKEYTKKYRDLLQSVRGVDLNEDELKVLVKKMRDNVIDQNQILAQVGVNEMISQDAKCMSVSSMMSYNLVKKFNTECKFEKREFLIRLRQRILSNSQKCGLEASRKNREPRNISNSSRIEFNQLFGNGLAFSGFQHQTPAVFRSFLATENQPEKRVIRRTQRQTGEATATQATKVNSANLQNEEDESEKRLRHIHKQLCRLQQRNATGTPLIQSAVNPNSFSTTVENFFNIAFLARQKLVKIKPPAPDDDDEEPIVEAFRDPNTTDAVAEEIVDDEIGPDGNKRENVQSVFTFDHDTYQALISGLDITRAALK